MWSISGHLYITVQIYTSSPLSIDCPQTTIVVLLKFIIRSLFQEIFEHPRKCSLGAFYRSETNKFDFYTRFWSRNHINYNENTIHKQNITMNITAKHDLSFNADSLKWSIWINLKITDLLRIG